MGLTEDVGLTEAERAELRDRIASEQERTAARIAALERDFDDTLTASADAVRDDEHDPEGATIAFPHDRRRGPASIAPEGEAFRAQPPRGWRGHS